MKFKHYFILLCCLSSIYTQCRRDYFFPDPDDPGLSRFTSRGYEVATNYINGRAFINGGGYYLPPIHKDSTGNAIDTLSFTWGIQPNDSSGFYGSPYSNISFLLPVIEPFRVNDLLAFNGRRFSNPTIVNIQKIQDTSFKTLSGTANLYFVKVTESTSSSDKYIELSGLFDGNIGDSVLITKGRFDFEINEADLNF